MRTRLLSPTVVAGLAVVSAAVSLAAPAGSPERITAAMLLVFVLPGTAISCLLTGRRAPSFSEQILLVPALSICVVIFDSVALYVLGVRLSLTSWTTSVVAITLVCCIGGMLNATSGPAMFLYGPGRFSVSPPLLLAILVASALLTAAGIVTARSTSRRQRADRFTQLWVLRQRPGTAVIGIYNHEGHAVRYQLSVFGPTRKFRVSAILVGSRKSWTTRQSYRAGATGLRIQLTQPGGAASIVRLVKLTLPSARRSGPRAPTPRLIVAGCHSPRVEITNRGANRSAYELVVLLRSLTVARIGPIEVPGHASVTRVVPVSVTHGIVTFILQGTTAGSIVARKKLRPSDCSVGR